MWRVRGVDEIIADARESLRGLNRADRIKVVGRLSTFLMRVLEGHPCELGLRGVTRMRLHDGHGDRFVYVLPFDWHVTYRVAPDCTATEGFVDILHVGPLTVV